MKLLLPLILALALSSCALQPVAESPTTFAVCKAADVVTTAYALHTGLFVEKNPLVAPLIGHGYFPLIAVSIAVWYALKRLSNPTATMAVNAFTCPIALHNTILITR